jgi:protein-L-isoaspartate O-methyltransferase
LSEPCTPVSHQVRRLTTPGGLFRYAAALLTAALLSGCDPSNADPATAPYIPSPDGVVAEMLEMADVGPEDHVIDLGSGDGRIVLTAAKVFGASGMGVEIRRDLVALSNAAAREQGLADRVHFIEQDLFDTDISKASVVTMYLLPEMVNRLKDKLLGELQPGARVLSHDYPIEGWDYQRFVQTQRDDKIPVTGVARTNLYLYVVPAAIGGRWRASLPANLGMTDLMLEFEQDVTQVTGLARLDGRRYPLEALRLQGRSLSFQIPELDAAFSGNISSDGLQGNARVGQQFGVWRARRNADP